MVGYISWGAVSVNVNTGENQRYLQCANIAFGCEKKSVFED